MTQFEVQSSWQPNFWGRVNLYFREEHFLTTTLPAGSNNNSLSLNDLYGKLIQGFSARHSYQLKLDKKVLKLSIFVGNEENIDTCYKLRYG